MAVFAAGIFARAVIIDIVGKSIGADIFSRTITGFFDASCIGTSACG